MSHILVIRGSGVLGREFGKSGCNWPRWHHEPGGR